MVQLNKMLPYFLLLQAVQKKKVYIVVQDFPKLLIESLGINILKQRVSLSLITEL